MIDPILLSLKVSLIATCITFFLGLLLAYLFTHYDFWGKSFFEALIILPLVLPPSVVGYLLLLVIGRTGIVGQLFESVAGAQIVFTWVAAVIAAVIVTIPLMYQAIKVAFHQIDPVYADAAKTLGAGKWRVFTKITLPLSIGGILSGIVLSFARALGEFGATLMVAGNIPGKTQTMPLAIYFASESGDYATANSLVLIMTVFSFIVIFIVGFYLKKSHYLEIVKRRK